MRRAVFLDRDGTLIQHVHHLADPAQVRLLPGVPAAIRRLQSSGYSCIVVTNQSVVGRGLLTDAGLQEVHDELNRQLEQHDVQLDGLYTCTIRPAQADPTVVEHLDRKPGPGMLWRAAREMGLDVSQSWMVGDAISDILAGRNAGCRGTVLLSESVDEGSASEHDAVQFAAADLAAAAELILAHDAREAVR